MNANFSKDCFYSSAPNIPSNRIYCMFCEMIMGLGSIQMPTYTTTIDMGYRLWNDMLDTYSTTNRLDV